MGVEIELKAMVDNPQRLSRLLDDIGSFSRRYHKVDRYFGHAADPVHTLFRLRLDDGRWICTSKNKHIVEGTEQNQETEFEVSDGDAFCRLVDTLGLHVVVEKRKVGTQWQIDGINAELSAVNEIGHFLELELILPDGSDDEAMSDARGRLFSLLHRLNISTAALESRPYTHIIYENISAAEKTTGSPV